MAILNNQEARRGGCALPEAFTPGMEEDRAGLGTRFGRGRSLGGPSYSWLASRAEAASRPEPKRASRKEAPNDCDMPGPSSSLPQLTKQATCDLPRPRRRAGAGGRAGRVGRPAVSEWGPTNGSVSGWFVSRWPLAARDVEKSGLERLDVKEMKRMGGGRMALAGRFDGAPLADTPTPPRQAWQPPEGSPKGP